MRPTFRLTGCHRRIHLCLDDHSLTLCGLNPERVYRLEIPLCRKCCVRAAKLTFMHDNCPAGVD